MPPTLYDISLSVFENLTLTLTLIFQPSENCRVLTFLSLKLKVTTRLSIILFSLHCYIYLKYAVAGSTAVDTRYQIFSNCSIRNAPELWHWKYSEFVHTFIVTKFYIVTHH